MRFRLSLLAPILMLAACGGEQQDAVPPENAPPATAAASPSPAPATPVANAIPVRFHGVWDAATGTCNPASDLRLEVAAGTIGFYESLGTVTGVTEAADGAARVALAMEGEGDTWEMAMTLALSDGEAGPRLIVRHDADGEAPAPEPLTLERCPA